jgi:hypothetical protein
MDSGEDVIYASSYTYSPEHIEFSETEDVSRATTYYTMDSLAPRRTRLSIDYYIPKNPIGEIFFRWTKKEKAEAAFLNSLNNLDAVAKGIRIPEGRIGTLRMLMLSAEWQVGVGVNSIG